MSKEAFYDEEIAPALLGLVEQCKSRGISLIAMCEFGPNETGTTRSIENGAGIEIVMSDLAMRARGNADVLIMALRKHGEKYGHNSVLLNSPVLERKNAGT